MNNEKEYIDREAVLTVLKAVFDETDPVGEEQFGVLKAHRIVREAPAADVAPVVHGEWKIKSEIHLLLDDVDEEIYVECPYCQRTFWVNYEFEDEKIIKYAREHYPYCNCGAKIVRTDTKNA
jgi:hypothetical protein